MATSTAEMPRVAFLVVTDPGGNHSKIPLQPLPFRIGRQPDNHLVLRDTRASRHHARILFENGEYVLEDEQSRYGVWVNGKRVQRQVLRNSDRIEFGVTDSYRLVFAVDGAELARLMEQLATPEVPSPLASTPAGGNLAKLRAVLDVARALQTSFSTDDVLKSVVDAALAITGAERGFLLLRQGDTLETRVARNREGHTLSDSDLRVPRRVIQRALEQRRDLLSMNFDPQGEAGLRPEQSIADLELRSVTSVPLVRINTSAGSG
ncbi:MAG TPA: FHA domain-containing protein, partial [Bryobacteraceae bacterium]|nr:FHA domain-containing protein [Bryobacteraceae bacterium]